MKIKSDMSGLKRLAENAKKLEGTTTVMVMDLFSPAFMSKYTKSHDFGSFCELGGFTVETAEDFAAIPDEDWEAHVIASSSFSSWAEMQQSAGAEYLKAQLFKGMK